MRSWNKIGKIKSIIVLIMSIIPLCISNLSKSTELQNEFYLETSVIIIIFIHLFLPLVIKFWSLFGFTFQKPKWNEIPFSLNFSKSLNSFQFMGYWLISFGFIKILFVGLFFKN